MKRAREHRQETQVTARAGCSGRRGSQLRRCAPVLAAGLLTVLVLASCSGSPAGGAATSPAAGASRPGQANPGTGAAGTPQSGAAGSGTAAPGATPAAADAATAAMKQKVTDALRRLAAGTPKPATAQVADALTGAGIAPAALEVSASRTPTGLEADAVEAAVLQGEDCVVGQVRGGSVTVTVLPVLASGKCFVGTGT